MTNRLAEHADLMKTAAGTLLLWTILEGTARAAGDITRATPALVVCLAVVTAAMAIEKLFFGRRIQEVLWHLGFGASTTAAVATAIGISVLLFGCLPVISRITGFSFRVPPHWPDLAIGLFALHGIAEEVVYRGFLFRHLREGRSFWRAGWMSVPFFAVAHIPIVMSQGFLVGGVALTLSVVVAFPLALLYERGKGTIWAPAILHAAIDVLIPLVINSPPHPAQQTASALWMAASMLLPYLAFLLLRARKQDSNASAFT